MLVCIRTSSIFTGIHIDQQHHWYLDLFVDSKFHNTVVTVVFQFSTFGVLCLCSHTHTHTHTHTTDPAVTTGRFFLSILTFIILYNNLIPISLIVTLEVSGYNDHSIVNILLTTSKIIISHGSWLWSYWVLLIYHLLFSLPADFKVCPVIFHELGKCTMIPVLCLDSLICKYMYKWHFQWWHITP